MCDKELQKLQNALKKSCEKYQPRKAKAQCQAYATKTVNDAAVYPWHESLVSDHIGAKVPVFWAGFSDFDTSGMASKKDLTDFVIDVNGLLLHGGLLAPQTEWGKVVQALGYVKMFEVLLLNAYLCRNEFHATSYMMLVISPVSGVDVTPLFCFIRLGARKAFGSERRKSLPYCLSG